MKITRKFAFLATVLPEGKSSWARLSVISRFPILLQPGVPPQLKIVAASSRYVLTNGSRSGPGLWQEDELDLEARSVCIQKHDHKDIKDLILSMHTGLTS